MALAHEDRQVVLDSVRQVPANDSKSVSFPAAIRPAFSETEYACSNHECPYDWAYHGTSDCCRSSVDAEVTMKPYIVPSDCL